MRKKPIPVEGSFAAWRKAPEWRRRARTIISQQVIRRHPWNGVAAAEHRPIPIVGIGLSLWRTKHVRISLTLILPEPLIYRR